MKKNVYVLVFIMGLCSCGNKSNDNNSLIDVDNINLVDSIFSDCTQYKSFVRKAYNENGNSVIVGVTNFSEDVEDKAVTNVAIGSFKGRIFKLLCSKDGWTVGDSGEISFSDFFVVARHSDIVHIEDKQYLFLSTEENCGGSSCATFDNCVFYLIDTNNLEVTSIVCFRENGILEDKAYEPYNGNDARLVFLHNKINELYPR